MDQAIILAEYRPWLLKVAHAMAYGDAVQDLAQEGWVAMWQALRSYNGSSPLDYWLKRKAHGRMLRVVTQVGWNKGKSEEKIDGLDFAIPESPLIDLGDAMATLTERQREYVYLRFWEGYDYSDLTRHFGYDPNSLWNSPKNGAKKKIRERLLNDPAKL